MQGDVAADGSHPGSVRRWQRQAAAENELEAAELAVNRKDKVRLSWRENAMQHSITLWLLLCNSVELCTYGSSLRQERTALTLGSCLLTHTMHDSAYF